MGMVKKSDGNEDDDDVHDADNHWRQTCFMPDM